MGYLIPYPRWANWPFVTDSGFMLMGVGAALSPPLPGNSDTPFPSGILGLMALPVCLQISISLATVRRGQALYCMLMPRCKRMKNLSFPGGHGARTQPLLLGAQRQLVPLHRRGQ